MHIPNLTKATFYLQCGKRVGDLFEDLRDGHNLVSLLEVLASEHLVSLNILHHPHICCCRMHVF